MTYATPAALLDRLGAPALLALLGNRTTDPADPAAVLAVLAAAPSVQRALGDAQAEVDGYIAGRYALPLATVPPVLERLACDVARYRLYESKPTPEIRQRYEDAVRVLEQIARGTVTLGLPAADAPAPVPGRVEFSAPPRRFSRDSLGGF